MKPMHLHTLALTPDMRKPAGNCQQAMVLTLSSSLPGYHLDRWRSVRRQTDRAQCSWDKQDCRSGPTLQYMCSELTCRCFYWLGTAVDRAYRSLDTPTAGLDLLYICGKLTSSCLQNSMQIGTLDSWIWCRANLQLSPQARNCC
jgi:hypothetical protein